MTQLKIPAVYMRGGSKGVFFHADSYGKHIDGMGGATSSTSKVVILSKSCQA